MEPQEIVPPEEPFDPTGPINPFDPMPQTSPQQSKLYRFSLRGPDGDWIAEHLRSGHYDYEAEFTFSFGDGEDKVERVRTIRGATEIINRLDDELGADEFGKKWALPELDRIFPSDGVSVALSSEETDYDRDYAAASRLAVCGRDGRELAWRWCAATTRRPGLKWIPRRSRLRT